MRVNVCHWMLSTQALRSRGNYERLAIDMCSNHCKSWRGSNSVHVITVAHGATQLQSSILTKIFSKDRGPLMTRWWYYDISSRTLQLSYESSWLSYNIFDHPSPRRDSAGVDHISAQAPLSNQTASAAFLMSANWTQLSHLCGTCLISEEPWYHQFKVLFSACLGSSQKVHILPTSRSRP